MRVYIAGQMSGLPDYGYDAFHHYASLWRSHGYDVLNPAERFGGRTDLPYDVYIKASIIDVLASDAIAMIPGWEESKGANLEHQIAEVLGLPIYQAEYPVRSDGSRVRGEAAEVRPPTGQHAEDSGSAERVLCCEGSGVPCQCGRYSSDDDPAEAGAAG